MVLTEKERERERKIAMVWRLGAAKRGVALRSGMEGDVSLQPGDHAHRGLIIYIANSAVDWSPGANISVARCVVLFLHLRSVPQSSKERIHTRLMPRRYEMSCTPPPTFLGFTHLLFSHSYSFLFLPHQQLMFSSKTKTKTCIGSDGKASSS